MKIGYLISGHPKTYNQSLSSYINNVKPIIDNVYGHFWWDNSYRNKCYKLHFDEKLEDLDLVEEINRQFILYKYKVEKSKKFDLSFFKNFTRSTWGNNSLEFYRVITPIVIYGLLCQTYSTYQSLLLSNEDDCDIIIKSRPDLIFTKSLFPIINELDFSDTKIYFQSSNQGGHLYAGEFPNKPCDWFFMGKKNVMLKFIEGWFKSISENYVNGILHTNELVKLVCDKNNLELNLINFGSLIYKQTTNYYDLHHINIEKYLQDFDFKNSKIINKDLWPYWVSDVDFNYFNTINFID